MNGMVKVYNFVHKKAEFSFLHAFPTSVQKITGESTSFQLPGTETLNPVFRYNLDSKPLFPFSQKYAFRTRVSGRYR